jgi:hypothetical protein
MWLWVGALPLWWLVGVPFGGALVFFAMPSLPLVLAMMVVLASVGLLARVALNY